MAKRKTITVSESIVRNRKPKPKTKRKTAYQKHQEKISAETEKRHKELVKSISFLLAWSEDITNGHIKNRGGQMWPIHTQLMHTTSELGEVYEAMRQGKCDMETMEELWDVLFSACTCIIIYLKDRLSHIDQRKKIKLKYTTLLSTIKKVESRLSQVAYKVEG